MYTCLFSAVIFKIAIIKLYFQSIFLQVLVMNIHFICFNLAYNGFVDVNTRFNKIGLGTTEIMIPKDAGTWSLLLFC